MTFRPQNGHPPYWPVKERIEEELERGTREQRHFDLSKYLALNVGVAAVTAGSLIVLAYLIPMLFRGVVFLARSVAFLVRRYWRWLNAQLGMAYSHEKFANLHGLIPLASISALRGGTFG
jgi:hypothetical protein